jgi:hypothetical protein
MRGRRPFPVSPVGWIGIAAGVLGLAYFLVPEESALERSARRPLPETRMEAAPATANRNEVIAPAVHEKTDASTGVDAKRDAASSAQPPAVRR